VNLFGGGDPVVDIAREALEALRELSTGSEFRCIHGRRWQRGHMFAASRRVRGTGGWGEKNHRVRGLTKTAGLHVN